MQPNVLGVPLSLTWRWRWQLLHCSGLQWRVRPEAKVKAEVVRRIEGLQDLLISIRGVRDLRCVSCRAILLAVQEDRDGQTSAHAPPLRSPYLASARSQSMGLHPSCPTDSTCTSCDVPLDWVYEAGSGVHLGAEARERE